MRCAVAVGSNTTVARLTDAERDIRVTYAEPMLNSRAALADFAVKFSSVRPGFGSTRTCARYCGFDEDSIKEMEAEERRNRANMMVGTLMMDMPEDEEPTVEAREATTSQSDDVAGSDVQERDTSSMLNGAQVSSLVNIMQQFQDGMLTEGQAVNLISIAIAIPKEDARALLKGE
jgi:hypothetical protein